MVDNPISDQETAVISGLQQQQRRIQLLLTQVVEPDAWVYLNEGALCFAVGAYGAAVVMGWCAVASFYRLVARQHYKLFSYCYQDVYNKEIGDPNKIGDWELIQTCERMGMVLSAKGRLDDFQAKRNRCAHPGRISINPIEPIEIGLSVWPSEVVSLFDQAVDLVLCRQVMNERLTGQKGASLVLDFLKQAPKKGIAVNRQETAELLDILASEQYRFLVHRLRLAFKSPAPDWPEPEALLWAWELILDRLDQNGRNEQFKKLREDMQEHFDEDLKRWNCGEVIRLSKLVYLSNPDLGDQSWHQLCKILVENLEQIVEQDEDVNVPRALSRVLRDHTPPDLKERVEAVRERLF